MFQAIKEWVKRIVVAFVWTILVVLRWILLSPFYGFLVRHILTAVGAILVTRHFLTEQELVIALSYVQEHLTSPQTVGEILILLGLGGSAVNKAIEQKKTKEIEYLKEEKAINEAVEEFNKGDVV